MQEAVNFNTITLVSVQREFYGFFLQLICIWTATAWSSFVDRWIILPLIEDVPSAREESCQQFGHITLSAASLWSRRGADSTPLHEQPTGDRNNVAEGDASSARWWCEPTAAFCSRGCLCPFWERCWGAEERVEYFKQIDDPVHKLDQLIKCI